MTAPIVIGLPPDDVAFVCDLLAECERSCARIQIRTARPGWEDYHDLQKLCKWRGDEARRILNEIKRQDRACRKEMREAGA